MDMTRVYDRNVIATAIRLSKYAKESLLDIQTSHYNENFRDIRLTFLIQCIDELNFIDVADGLEYNPMDLRQHGDNYRVVNVVARARASLDHLLVKRHDMWFMQIKTRERVILDVPLYLLISLEMISHGYGSDLDYEIVGRPPLLIDSNGELMDVRDAVELFALPTETKH